MAMMMSYPPGYMDASMSREEYEHRKRMEWEMQKYQQMSNIYQSYAGPGPVDAPAEPKKPKHLNPKLLITKGSK